MYHRKETCLVNSEAFGPAVALGHWSTATAMDDGETSLEDWSQAEDPLTFKRRKVGPPLGPQSQEESSDWPDDVLLMLFRHGTLDPFLQCLEEGICLSTDYSGMGSAEEALRCLCLAAENWSRQETNSSGSGSSTATHRQTPTVRSPAVLHRLQNFSLAGEEVAASTTVLPVVATDKQGGSRPHVVVQRAGDIEADCRNILLHHWGMTAPKCVHGDIGSRCRARIWTAVTEDIKRLQRSSKSRDSISPEKFAEAVLNIFREQNFLGLKAWCFKHKKDCPVGPSRHNAGESAEARAAAAAEDACRIKVNVAGWICTDWSAMGSRRGWYGLSTPPFMQWLSERLAYEEDVVIGENTKGFDGKTLAKLVQEYYDTYILEVSPTLLGEPCERQRLYFVLLHKRKRRFRHQWVAEDVQGRFEAVFRKEVVMSPHLKFRAPEAAVTAYIEKLAATHHLPFKPRSGKSWSCYQSMSAAMREKVQEHTAAMQNKITEEPGKSNPNMWVTNLTQTADFMPPTFGRVPAMLQRSTLWLFGHRRVALPLEHVEVQALNVFGSGVYRCEFADELSKLSEARIKSIAGNAMNIRVCASVLAFVLAETEAKSKPNPNL